MALLSLPYASLLQQAPVRLSVCVWVVAPGQESRSPSVEFHPAAAARDGSPALSPAGPKPAPSAPAKSDLEALPYEVLRRVMCCLSAEGLATMANTSRAIRTLSTENSLWYAAQSPTGSQALPHSIPGTLPATNASPHLPGYSHRALDINNCGAERGPRREGQLVWDKSGRLVQGGFWALRTDPVPRWCCALPSLVGL